MGSQKAPRGPSGFSLRASSTHLGLCWGVTPLPTQTGRVNGAGREPGTGRGPAPTRASPADEPPRALLGWVTTRDRACMCAGGQCVQVRACVHLRGLTKQKLSSWAWGGLAGPRSLALAPDPPGLRRPPTPCPRVLTQVPPFLELSVRASGAYVNHQTDGRTDGRRATPSFLPRSTSCSWCPGWGLSSPRRSLSPSHGARRGLQQ